MEAKKSNTPPRMYPILALDRIKNPNRLYAVPLLGLLIKIILLIPVFIVMFFYGIGYLVIVMIMNPFSVLFKGKYWDRAYAYNVGYLRLSAKTTLYFFGLTDTYPGFSFEGNDSFSLDIVKPEHPNKLFAIPILGIVMRMILLIPYFIYESVLGNGAYVGAALSSFSVLFKGYYPESTFEFIRDYTRVSLGASVYISGLSDTYPSFHISMNHKKIKVALIVAGVILMILNSSHPSKKERGPQYPSSSITNMTPYK